MSDEKLSYDDLMELVKSLRAKVAELEQKLQEANRQSAPFRRREALKKTPEQKKPSGRPEGHKGEFRRQPASVDQKVEVPLPSCPCCGGQVTGVTCCKQFIEELPPVKPIVIELTTWQGTCSQCGEVRSTHPLQTSTATGAAGTHLGPRAQAVAVALSHQSGLSMRRSCHVLKSLCGLKLSPGGLAQLLQRASIRLTDWYNDILETIRGSRAVFADETSWYVGEPGWWLWVFTTPETTLYRVEKCRGSAVVQDTLTDNYKGMLVSDCLASYNEIDCRKHKCIAHHLRVLSEHQETLLKRGINSQYLMLCKLHLTNVIAAYNQRSAMSAEQFTSKVLQLQRGIDHLLGRSPPEPEEVKFRNRLRRQKNHLLGCLSEPAAEPTNNRAERDLRPAVIDRKLSCGNKTTAGKTAWEMLRSIVITTQKQNRDVIETLAPKFRIATA